MLNGVEIDLVGFSIVLFLLVIFSHQVMALKVEITPMVYLLEESQGIGYMVFGGFLLGEPVHQTEFNELGFEGMVLGIAFHGFFESFVSGGISGAFPEKAGDESHKGPSLKN